MPGRCVPALIQELQAHEADLPACISTAQDVVLGKADGDAAALVAELQALTRA